MDENLDNVVVTELDNRQNSNDIALRLFKRLRVEICAFIETWDSIKAGKPAYKPSKGFSAGKIELPADPVEVTRILEDLFTRSKFTPKFILKFEEKIVKKTPKKREKVVKEKFLEMYVDIQPEFLSGKSLKEATREAFSNSK